MITGSTTTVDIQLAVGAVTEVVNVAEAAAQIDYESNRIDGVIQRQQIESLPLNGRSFLQLAFLQPAWAWEHNRWPSTTPSSASRCSVAAPR